MWYKINQIRYLYILSYYNLSANGQVHECIDFDEERCVPA